MPVRSFVITLCVALSLASLMGCAPEPRSPSNGRAGNDKSEALSGQAADRITPPSAARSAPATPSPADVLEGIYQDAGNRSSSYEVGNGSRATYWFGYVYEMGGKQYFTGFAEQSPDHLTSDSQQDDPPSAKATLTQATFVAAATAGKWRFLGAQRFVGEVGTRGRADAVDPSRQPVAQPAGRERFLLAVPTDGAIEQGTVQKNYDVLLRDADGTWSYAGTVNAGYDDSAGCDEGRAFPCEPVVGRVAIGPGDRMPSIRVTLEPSNPKRGTARTVVYRFDTATSLFQPL